MPPFQQSPPSSLHFGTVRLLPLVLSWLTAGGRPSGVAGRAQVDREGEVKPFVPPVRRAEDNWFSLGFAIADSAER
jgi:hypothetical protein